MKKILSYFCALLLIGLYAANADATFNGSGSGPVQPSAGFNSVTVIVAPSNASAKAKAGANIVCTGTADDVCIENAINSLPNYSVTGGTVSPANLWHSGTVQLLHGTFNTAATINIDCDYCNIQGENFPMFGGYIHSWSGTGSPAANIGTGETKIQATATGYPILTFTNNNIPAGNGTGTNDQNRHRGISISRLYLVGDAYSADGIDSSYGATPLAGGDDASTIDNVMIQRCIAGIAVGQDSWMFGPNIIIQDDSATGIVISGTNGIISHNLIFDIGGMGIQSFTGNLIIEGNRLGDIGTTGIYMQGASSAIANVITNTGTNGIEVDGNNSSVIGNSIITNSPGGGSPIDINNGATGITITANSIKPLTSSSAVAIALSFGTPNTASANIITGTFSGGYIVAFNAAVYLADEIVGNAGAADNLLGGMTEPTYIATGAAPTTAAGQVGYGGTTAAVANCGALATACIVVNVAGTTHYIPYF